MSNTSLAKQIFHDALEASLPKNFISKACQLDGDILKIGTDEYDLAKYKNIYLFGSGKASYTMALEIEDILQDRIDKGLVVSPKIDENSNLKYIQLAEGSHPYPDEKSLSSAKKLITLMQECTEDDLYIYLLSGGSSALIELPIEPISLKDFHDATQMMLNNALDIHEINVVRKHISQIKGGRVAQKCKAKGIVLVLSDIIDNDLYSIGSAPLYADKSSFLDAKEILDSYKIFSKMPNSVQEVILKGIEKKIDETPEFESKNTKHYVVASNVLALDAAAKSALSHKLSVKVVKEPMEGNVTDMVQNFLQTLEVSTEDCILFGGECTVKVEGSGEGGRNQHAVALMLREICKKNLEICFLSAATDGIDGNSDAAGAVVDSSSCKKTDEKEIEKYINNFDSYNLFKSIDSLVMSGASGTNVIDIAIIIKGK